MLQGIPGEFQNEKEGREPISPRDGNRPDKARRLCAPVEIKRRRIRGRLALERQRIAGAERLHYALVSIEAAQEELRIAHGMLRNALTRAPLAKAFADFQQEGGVSADDWRDWLNGYPLDNEPLHSKRHLHLIVNHEPTPASSEEPDDDYDEPDDVA